MKKPALMLSVLGIFAVVGIMACLLCRRSAPAQSDDRDRAGRPGQSTPPTEAHKPVTVVPYVPPSTHNPELARFVNREAEGRVTPDLSTRLPKVQHPDDVKAVVSVLLDTQDDDTVRHEAASLLHRSNYAGLTDDLLKVLNNPAEKERFRSFVVQHLWSQTEKAKPAEKARITEVLHASLADRHTAVRREALLALVRLKDPQGVETALKWLDDPSPDRDAVRDLGVRVVREQNLREHLPRIRELLRSPNDDVKRQAMVTVGEWGDQESKPALEEAAKSDKPLVKSTATAALKRLDEAKARAPAAQPKPQ